MASIQYASLVANLGIMGIVQGEEFRARCPFHSDHSPSFSMNIGSGLWICHKGCGSGSFPQLVEQVLDCSVQEAYEWVATNGMSIGANQLSQQLATILNQQAPEGAASVGTWRDHYHSLSNNVMPQWFFQRGFTWDTVTHWAIRYDPASDGIVVPVFWKGELLGTVTRPLYGVPKYQNSQNLPKSEILFGEISSAKNEIIIVEGLLDALWLWQLGYHAVSILGDALSQKQVDILRSYRFGQIILSLDNDGAGQKGTHNAIDLLFKSGWLLTQIQTIKFPPGKKDPQDCSSEEFYRLYVNRKDAYIGQFT